MEQLAAWASAFGLSLDANQLAQFAAYEALLLAWNERISLTAIRVGHEIRIRHFLDALTCATVTGPLDGRALVDVGSGAGFPGLPLKILYPDLRLTLVDSVAKKARFLELVAGELGLRDVTVLAERAETLGQDAAFREQFDWATGRAVAELRVLAELLLPLCRVGGHVLAQKGDSAPAEVAAAGPAIAALGGGPATVSTIRLPETDKAHYLVLIPKIVPTAGRYPRRAGMPAKRPL
ncbi:Ribosomal RNA small subunit methyltransferase G [Candidatus Promineifilum breve]|uniref:Ribosomal RNA small subunit methyltransferase G n=1 Tax=Candidatus Promineifilum breve TaxID=1806508 RepID=A0A161K2U5_9CHLR|nr:16S rRNA (guanine(527)-N(7))-methyltransferase RsmG [Candidatus Promineifilum breve]CUS02647.2 Ribosomal RNA small subunit methyltransferase G [Candidatus Promineifilum breve]